MGYFSELHIVMCNCELSGEEANRIIAVASERDGRTVFQDAVYRMEAVATARAEGCDDSEFFKAYEG